METQPSDNHSSHAATRPKRRRPYSVSGAIACAAGLLALAASALVMPTKDQVGPAALAITVLVWTAVCSLCITGIGIGGAALFKRGSRRLLPALGITVSALAFGLFVLQLTWPTTGTLLTAAYGGDLVTAQRCVRWGVDTAKPGPLMIDGERMTVTPLMAAALGGQVTISKLLITNGASANSVVETGPAPLCIAVDTGHINLTRLLLKKGADPNIACEGEPLLRAAARHGSRDLVIMLLDHGAQPNSAASLALHDAAEHRHAATVKLLLQRGLAVDTLNQQRQTALHLAAIAGQPFSVRYLLEEGADPNVVDVHGQTPLDLAVHHEHDELAQQLLEAGAEVDAYTAVALNDADRLALLLKQDPSNLDMNRRGLSLLHEAARRGHVRCAEILLAHEADADASTTEPPYVTPLFLAVKNGHAALVEQLLDQGADIGSTYVEGDLSGSVLYFAVVYDREAVFNLLLARGSDADVMCQDDLIYASLLYFAVRHGRRYAVDELIAHRVPVDSRPSNNAPTPLFEAVRRGEVELVALLLANGADPLVAVAEQTPLNAAEARRGREPAIYDPIIELLTSSDVKRSNDT